MMKKLLALVLSIAIGMAVSGFALAEGELPVGEFIRLTDGQTIDLDGDGSAETIGFVWENTDDVARYTLQVDGLQISSENEAWYLTGDVYAVRFSGVSGAFLLVSDYGPSDDDTSYIYHYVVDYEGAASLSEFATVGAMPGDMTVTGPNTFTTYIRAARLMTWHRPADYVIATGLYYSEDEVKITYALAEVPRDLYPLGAQVTLKRDLPLMVSRTDDEVAMTLQAGESAVVAATDDVCWIYIVPEKYADDCLYTGGWVRMPADGFAEILVDGESVPAYDVMDGLLYAD